MRVAAPGDREWLLEMHRRVRRRRRDCRPLTPARARANRRRAARRRQFPHLERWRGRRVRGLSPSPDRTPPASARCTRCRLTAPRVMRARSSAALCAELTHAGRQRVPGHRCCQRHVERALRAARLRAARRFHSVRPGGARLMPPRFHVASPLSPALVGTTIALPDEVAHHVVRVLRLDVGAALTLFDGTRRRIPSRARRSRQAGMRPRGSSASTRSNANRRSRSRSCRRCSRRTRWTTRSARRSSWASTAVAPVVAARSQVSLARRARGKAACALAWRSRSRRASNAGAIAFRRSTAPQPLDEWLRNGDSERPMAIAVPAAEPVAGCVRSANAARCDRHRSGGRVHRRRALACARQRSRAGAPRPARASRRDGGRGCAGDAGRRCRRRALVRHPRDRTRRVARDFHREHR